MLRRCKACGHFGRVKISLSYATKRSSEKWICRNRKACVRRQREAYDRKHGK